MSAVYKFRSAPITDPDASFSFVVYGDMGVTVVPGAHDTAKYMIEEAMNGSSLVFHVGDISYARGYVSRPLSTWPFSVFAKQHNVIFPAEPRTYARVLPLFSTKICLKAFMTKFTYNVRETKIER